MNDVELSELEANKHYSTQLWLSFQDNKFGKIVQTRAWSLLLLSDTNIWNLWSWMFHLKCLVVDHLLFKLCVVCDFSWWFQQLVNLTQTWNSGTNLQKTWTHSKGWFVHWIRQAIFQPIHNLLPSVTAHLTICKWLNTWNASAHGTIAQDICWNYTLFSPCEFPMALSFKFETHFPPNYGCRNYPLVLSALVFIRFLCPTETVL